jgi:rhamnosyltransferase subunit B
MNIFLVANGTAGDLHPLIGVGSVLASEGHAVTFFTNDVFADVVERCGLRFVSTGTAKEYYALRERASDKDAARLARSLWQSLIDSIRPSFDLLVSKADANTVIAAHPWAMAARLVQEKHGVPLVTPHVSPATILPAELPRVHRPVPIPLWLPRSIRSGLLWMLERGLLDRMLGPDINRLRTEFGLPPVTYIVGRWMNSPQGVLGLFPDWFAPPQSDWPSRVSLTGFPMFDQGDFRELDPETEEFVAKGRPPVVFTIGSTAVDEIGYYEAATATVKALDLRAVFLTNQKLSVSDPDILVRSYVPLSRVLPRASAIVHHGGTGTVSHAFAAGIPQLITPFVYDQFDNAIRIERLGCRMWLTSRTLSRHMLPALRRLLENEQIRQRCIALRSKMESGSSACHRALSEIENVASQTTGAVSRGAGL